MERLLRVATQAFGEAVGRDVAAELSESGSQDLFFALWGLSESVIKMNRGAPSDDEFAALRFHRNSVTFPAEVDVTVAVESRDPNTKAAADGEAAAKVVRHAARFVKTRAPGLLRTTVVAEGETPPVVVEADVALLKRMFGFARPGRATPEPETRDT